MSYQPKPATKAGKIILDAASQLRDMAMEPKPRTGDCTCDIDTVCAVHGGGKPKPTTGEWTVDDETVVTPGNWNFWIGDPIVAKRIADAHNAALAAEREAGKTEREKVQPLVDALKRVRSQCQAPGRAVIDGALARLAQNTGLDWIGRGDQ